MFYYEEAPSHLNFIEPRSPCDFDLIAEVATSDDLNSILTMLLLDETLSDSLKNDVKNQLRMNQIK
jgi:hypothetical protein